MRKIDSLANTSNNDIVNDDFIYNIVYFKETMKEYDYAYFSFYNL